MHELNTKNMAVRQKCLAAFLYVRGQIVPAMFINENAYITQIIIDNHKDTKRNFQKTGTKRTRFDYMRIYAEFSAALRRWQGAQLPKMRWFQAESGTLCLFFWAKSYATI